MGEIGEMERKGKKIQNPKFSRGTWGAGGYDVQCLRLREIRSEKGC